jgi:hypothetical protein
MTEFEDHQPHVDRAIADARATEPGPPPGFSATVMRRVHDAEAGFSMFRRWQRRRAIRVANLAAPGRVDSSVPAAAWTRRVLWGVATVGAGAVVAMVSFGVPQVGPGTEGAMGAGSRQPEATAVVTPMSVTQFLQSDTFDRVTRNESARLVLEKAGRDTAFRAALVDPAQRATITDPAFRQAMNDPAFHTTLDWPHLSSALTDPTFLAALKPRK